MSTLLTAQALDTAAQDAITTGDVEELAAMHVELARFAADLRMICRAVEQRLADVMPDKTIELDGLPVLERRRGTKRNHWHSDELVKLLVHRAIDPDEDGVIPGTITEAVERTTDLLTRCAPFTPSMGWRVTALKALDIDPDEWCETAPGPVSVQIHEATR